jgi:hypothetical protein
MSDRGFGRFVLRAAALAAALSLLLGIVAYPRQSEAGGTADADREGPKQTVLESKPAEKDARSVDIALARFASDSNLNAENELRAFLSGISPNLRVRLSRFDSQISVNPNEDEVTRIRSVLAQANAEAAVGGAVYETAGGRLLRSFVIDAAPRSIAGVYRPSYFELPKLELHEEANLVELLIGLKSVEKLSRGICYDPVADLAPLMAHAERLANAESPTLTHDDRARLNFIAAAGLARLGQSTGSERRVEKSNAYYLQALSDWAEQNNSLNSAMALLGLGSNLAWIGKRRGDRAMSHAAVSVFAVAEQVYEAQHDPLDQSAASDMAGLALVNMASGGKTGYLFAAKAKFEVALGLASRDQDPQFWASIQNHLGATIERLGVATSNPELIKEAIAAYHASASATPRTDDFNWAANHTDLGNALRALGIQAADTSQLEQSVATYREALNGYGECYPAERADTEESIGISLGNIGLRHNRADYLQQALESFRSTLKYRSRVDDPVAKAITLANIAETSSNLAVMEESNAQLKEPINLWHDALRALPRERDPLQWAIIESHLGQALSVLGHRESSADDLERAIRVDRDALTTLTKSNDLSEWLNTEGTLAGSLNGLADMEHHDQAISDAQAALDEYRKVLEFTSRQHDPRGWALLQVGIGDALSTWGQHEAGTGHLRQAVQAFHDALSIITPAQDQSIWEQTENDLGIALSAIGLRETDNKNLEQSVIEFNKALSVLSPDKTPEEWNITQQNLSISIDELKRRGVKIPG